ncbi:hypothetical protein KSP40_PGU008829 [Platanthera guangdongensis]|uniref:Uncharacterized protein n=1 Tax=Platanthera guangdongensis TaxID=2320717 RepID=A0ABR2N4I4_9ASPA
MRRRRGVRGAAGAVYAWVRGQSVKAKAAIGALKTILALGALWALIHDHNHFFVAFEVVHAVGIFVLVYKLSNKKTCSGDRPPPSFLNIDFDFFGLISRVDDSYLW